MNATKVITIIGDNCNGCDRCMKRCPTEAIRVRESKAVIDYDRCVGCGECVRICPTHAKAEHYDPFEIIHNYKYKVALPSSSLYVQFNNIKDVDYLLTGLKKIGFDDVFEIAIGAEYVIDETRRLISEKKVSGPLISTVCPAVKNLILNRYENLVDNLSPIIQPEKLAARMALDKALKETGLPRKDIGIFVITPCGANVMELKETASEVIDGVLATKEIYFPLLAAVSKLTPEEVEPLCRCSVKGAICATNTDTGKYLDTDKFLTASGVEGVVEVLGEIEHEKLAWLDYVELFACPTGCTGGSMNIENCFLARAKMRLLTKYLPEKISYRPDKDYDLSAGHYQINNVYRLSDDFMEALRMTKRLNDILERLPKINCGYCGAPSCRAFAEDYVKGDKRRCKYLEDLEHDG